MTRDLSEDEAAHLIIAYEPVWAIGTGMVATPQSAQEAAKAIRNNITASFNEKVAGAIRILYGGSVSSHNVPQLIAGKDVDGFLVGGASLDVEEFSRIARLTLKSAL